MLCLDEFKYMFLGRKVKITTDNVSAAYILKNPDKVSVHVPSALSRAFTRIAGIEYEVEKCTNTSDESFKIVDLLSRSKRSRARIPERSVKELLEPIEGTFDEIDRDCFISDIIWDSSLLVDETIIKSPLVNISEFKKLIAIVHESENFIDKQIVDHKFQLPLIKAGHALNHSGRIRLAQLLSHYNIHWKSRNADIASFIQACETCGTKKANNNHIHSIDACYNTDHPMQELCVDINQIGTNPSYNILVAVCQFSKFGVARKINGALDTPNVIKVLISILASTGLATRQLLVDNGPQFKNKDFSKYMLSLGIEVRFTSRYNSRGNPCEVFNKKLNNTLRTQHAIPSARHFQLSLDVATATINSMPNEPIGLSSFEVVFGFPNLRATPTDLGWTEIDTEKCPLKIISFISQLKAIREVRALFFNPPNLATTIPNFHIGQKVRVQIQQKAGSNKIQALKFSEKIYEIVELKPATNTVKLIHGSDAPIISHIRFLRKASEESLPNTARDQIKQLLDVANEQQKRLTINTNQTGKAQTKRTRKPELNIQINQPRRSERLRNQDRCNLLMAAHFNQD